MAELLTTKDLAKKWKVQPRTLDNWRSARIGPPYVKIHGSVRYDETQCDEWLAEQNDRGGVA